MDPEEQASLLPSEPQPDSSSVKVWPLIVHLKRDAMSSVDTALSWDQLTASDVNFALVRPLVFKYARLKSPAVPFAALVVRSHFLALASDDLAYSGVMLSRANLLEILAMKLLAPFAHSKVQIASALATAWSPLAGAPDGVITEVQMSLGGDSDALDDPQSALEVAIANKAKAFLASPLVQTVVTDIYNGNVVLHVASNRSVLADNYKARGIEVYEPRKAPFLNHYRLRVPRYGNTLEFLNFAFLLFTFVLCLLNWRDTQMQASEIAFIIFAVAFALEEFTAQKEHGWAVYVASMWNVFDASFIVIFIAYIGTRARGLLSGDDWYSQLSFDILSCGACILFPRLAFFAVHNNIIVIALRGMISEFVLFMGLAAVCFSGLLFTLWMLAAGSWPVKKIMWLMVQIWFGNTYLSFVQAESFHPVFGPILMTVFAALSNTLLLTILISILSNTYARIDANAKQEYLYQYAIQTIEGVKSDALFSYQPPFNLLAFLILWPASWVLTPRALHTVNVFLIRLTSFPTLIVIGVYERYITQMDPARETGEKSVRWFFDNLPRGIRNSFLVDSIIGPSSSDLYDAMFDVDVEEEPELFTEEDGADTEGPALRSLASAENLYANRTPSHTDLRTPLSPTHRNVSPSAVTSHRGRRDLTPIRIVDRSSAAEIPSIGRHSPLAKLFLPRLQTPTSALMGEALGADIVPPTPTHPAVGRMEVLLEEFKALPVARMREEMKELQDRQARIENLLLVLTRGMRNDTGGSK